MDVNNQYGHNEFELKELTLNEVVQMHSFPIILKTCTSEKNRQTINHYGIHENKEILLQRIMRVKFARVKVLRSHVKEETCEKWEGDAIDDKNYLLPVNYHGKVRFVQRPGCRGRYATVSQILVDLPRYVTVWEDTPALPCSDADNYITVEANTTLEIVRKVTRPDDRSTILECSDGETVFAFNEQDRLNCTAKDDTKLYHLFELVRSKLLPRVFKFEAVNPSDIAHMDDNLYSETLFATYEPMELQGFTEVELLVGCVRNEKLNMYERVLIPQNLWTTFLVHEVCKVDTFTYISRLYGPCEEVNFIEKALYLLPVCQGKVLRLTGPAFSHEEKTNTMDEEMMHSGPVVLLPQVKKKQTLFKKVHKELLRWFKSSNDGKPNQQKWENLPRRKTKIPKRYTKRKQTRKPRSASLDDVRSEPVHLKYIRRKYGDEASYLDFCLDDADHQPQEIKPAHLRLSVSLGDIPETVFALPKSNENKSFSSKVDRLSDDYSEIVDVFDEYEEAGGVNNSSLCTAARLPTFSEETRVAAQSHAVIFPQKQSIREIAVPRNEVPREDGAQEAFYRYTVIESYECFKQCGLEEFASKCKEHKLDGAFFRNFDYENLKEEPFYLCKFDILKLNKIIKDGWRPT